MPAADVKQVEANPGIHVVDTAPRMLLVDSAPEEAEALVRALPDWVLSAERSVPLPKNPRRTLNSAAAQ